MAIIQEKQAMRLGLILQDENGYAIGCVAKNYSGWSLPNEAEAMALREATWLCQQRVTDVVIESDSLQVVQAFLENAHGKSGGSDF